MRLHPTCVPDNRVGIQTRLFIGTLALSLLWGVGQIARDWIWLTGLCFYIPSPLLALALVAWVGIYVRRKKWRIAALSACLALVPLGVILFAENHFWTDRVPRTIKEQVRLVHWNVGAGLSSNARSVLLAKRAQLYILTEIPDAQSVDDLRANLGSAYRSQTFGNLAVIAAGEVVTSGWLINQNRMRVEAVTCDLDGHTIEMLVVDLPSEIHIHRDPLLREINKLIEQRQPDLVVGDFNAPRRSRALCEMPAGYSHAYDTAGSGWGYTWPVPIPMYALDQCLHSSKIVPVRYNLESSISSDHRLQIFDFAWSPME